MFTADMCLRDSTGRQQRTVSGSMVSYYSGRFLPGTKELEEAYMAIQLRLEAGSLRLLRCPTCQESCNGVRYQEWLQVTFMQHHQADMTAGRRRVM